jgi:hypothetical protein
VLHFHAHTLNIRRSVVATVIVVAAALSASGKATAADHRVDSKTRTFECGALRPGDTITLPAGNRGPLRIRNCKGTQSSPIVVRNDANGTGPAVIRGESGSSGGFILNCDDCVGISFDGGSKWRGAPSGKAYGIKVTVAGRSSPSGFIRFGGLSRYITIRNVEVDGAWPTLAKYGSGIRINDLQVNRNAHPGLWREDILIEDNYIHDVALEGMYVGPNYSDGDLPLRDVEIRNNRVEDTGFEAINTKSMWAGDNRVHHNVVRRAGKNSANSSKGPQYSGIKNNAGNVKIYNNWVESTGQHGIMVWTQGGPKVSERRGPFEAHIWNNVIVDAGRLWHKSMSSSFGINIGAQNGVEKPIPFIYNNTIVNSRQRGINALQNVGSGGVVRDNIIAGSGGNPVISVIGSLNLLNNRIGSVSEMQFVDPSRMNFRLKTGSPARNEGTNEFPPTDHADVSRPKEGAADQGAFEGSGN